MIEIKSKINLGDLYPILVKEINNIFAQDKLSLEERNTLQKELSETFFKRKNPISNEEIIDYIANLETKLKTRFEEAKKYIERKPEKEGKVIYENPEDLIKKKQRKSRNDILNNELGEFENMFELAKAIYKKQPIYYDIANCYWIWNNEEKFWKLIDEVDLFLVIDDLLQNPETSRQQVKREIIEVIKRIGRRNAPLPLKPTWIQFRNQIVDVQTLEKIDVSPKYFATNPIIWKIGENTETPNMDRIFADWVSKENVPLLYDILAYCLLPDYPLARIFTLIGGGSNGKSKFLEIVAKFIGEQNICSTELDMLLRSRFEVAKLYKKLTCILGETNFNSMSKTSLIKKLVGKDPVGMEYKGKTPFDAVNYAKLIIATNSLPMTTDRTKGFYRRWVIIDFDNEFTEKKDILKDIPDEEYENLSNKCISLLRKILDERSFSNEGTIKDRMVKYEAKSNPLGRFIHDELKENPSGDILAKALYSDYCRWCEGYGHRILCLKEFISQLEAMGYDKKKRKDGVHIFGLLYSDENEDLIGVTEEDIK